MSDFSLAVTESGNDDGPYLSVVSPPPPYCGVAALDLRRFLRRVFYDAIGKMKRNEEQRIAASNDLKHAGAEVAGVLE
jgi:hypothetical protein